MALSFLYLSNVTELFGIPVQYGVLWSFGSGRTFLPTLARRCSLVAAALGRDRGRGYPHSLPQLAGLLFRARLNAGTGYTWLVADGLAMGECWPCWLVADMEHEVVCGSVTLICVAASMTMFIVGYPFGIFHASRFLGFTLRETALNLFFAGMVALAMLAGTSPWRGVVNRPVLQFFGEISYGLYLIQILIFDLEDYVVGRLFPTSSDVAGHFVLMVFLFTLALAFTVAIAYLSRLYFENLSCE